ncbi:MAG: catalase [Clostridia bacterium]|nr:catalase [Clostridia bacterium]
MIKALKHFCTITKHRHTVIKHCFKAGIFWQGLFHDLSKYSPVEFAPGIKYYTGVKSPNEGERSVYGFSYAWMHHKGRNKHHFEYWTDYDPVTKKMSPVKMPAKYLAEMFCDRVAASKTYQGKNYTNSHPLEYFNRGRAQYAMHPETAKKLHELLIILNNEGEKSAFSEIRKLVKENNY